MKWSSSSYSNPDSSTLMFSIFGSVLTFLVGEISDAACFLFRRLLLFLLSSVFSTSLSSVPPAMLISMLFFDSL